MLSTANVTVRSAAVAAPPKTSAPNMAPNAKTRFMNAVLQSRLRPEQDRGDIGKCHRRGHQRGRSPERQLYKSTRSRPRTSGTFDKDGLRLAIGQIMPRADEPRLPR